MFINRDLYTGFAIIAAIVAGAAIVIWEAACFLFEHLTVGWQ